MSRKRELSDVQWERIAPLMPQVRGRSRPFRDHRQVVEGIVYRYRCGVAWRDLPERFGPWQTGLAGRVRVVELNAERACGPSVRAARMWSTRMITRTGQGRAETCRRSARAYRLASSRPLDHRPDPGCCLLYTSDAADEED